MQVFTDLAACSVGHYRELREGSMPDSKSVVIFCQWGLYLADDLLSVEIESRAVDELLLVDDGMDELAWR